MEIFNPKKIKKADLIVGIPSYNEEKTISFVVEQVSKGLKKYFPEKKCVIVNVDNNSTDRTREAFLGSKSEVPLIFYITTPRGTKGKGYNFHALFFLFQEFKAKAGVVVDADLRSIRPDWVKKLAEPIFSGYDYVSPLYARKKDDATITNQIVYPLVYGLLGINIRQPIGGEFAFSNKLIDVWLGETWNQEAYQFGIDIFMSLNAILSGLKLCQVDLGKKVHKSSIPNLGPMFIQVVETLFFILKNHLNEIKKVKKIKEIPILYSKKNIKIPNTIPSYNHFEKLYKEEFNLNKEWFKKVLSKDTFKKMKKLQNKEEVVINSEIWVQIIYDFLYYFNKEENSKIIEALRCLYLTNFSPSETEQEILKQTQWFFKTRNYYLDKYL